MALIQKQATGIVVEYGTARRVTQQFTVDNSVLATPPKSDIEKLLEYARTQGWI